MTQVKKDRSALRNAILGTQHSFRAKTISFFGEEIELRQSTLKDVLDAQDTEDRKSAMVGMLVRYAYVPGTNEKVFEEEDADAIMQLPFGPDFTAVNEAIAEITGVNITVQEKNSDRTVSE